MAGVGKLLKQAQKMQKKIEALEAELATTTIDVSSGGGAISITIKVSGDIEAIRLDPEFLKEEKSFVEETLVTGVQEAIDAARKAKEEAMGGRRRMGRDDALRVPDLPHHPQVPDHAPRPRSEEARLVTPRRPADRGKKRHTAAPGTADGTPAAAVRGPAGLTLPRHLGRAPSGGVG